MQNHIYIYYYDLITSFYEVTWQRTLRLVFSFKISYVTNWFLNGTNFIIFFIFRDALERKGVDLSYSVVYVEGCRTPLPINTDTSTLGGKTLKVKGM